MCVLSGCSFVQISSFLGLSPEAVLFQFCIHHLCHLVRHSTANDLPYSVRQRNTFPVSFLNILTTPCALPSEVWGLLLVFFSQILFNNFKKFISAVTLWTRSISATIKLSFIALLLLPTGLQLAFLISLLCQWQSPVVGNHVISCHRNSCQGKAEFLLLTSLKCFAHLFYLCCTHLPVFASDQPISCLN